MKLRKNIPFYISFKSRLFGFIGLVGISTMVGCNYPPEVRNAIGILENQWNVLWGALLGETSQNQPAPTPSASSDSAEVGYGTSAAKNARENAEILHEIFLVVFDREPKDRSEFGNWADTLNQGASLEGVFNGLNHGADYRKLEIVSSSASVEALKMFSEELAILEIELEKATEFDLSTSSPLPEVPDTKVPVSGVDSARTAAQAPKTQETNQKEIQRLSEKYAKQFVGASIFTLKRILSDEALKVVGTKKDYREKLATWYSKWAVRMAQRNIDFGISLRNKPDEAFHYKWAMNSVEDRIKWEILNRLYRVMNEANRQKQ